MKGTSNLIMLLTLVLVVSLTIVLGWVLLLLAELYCSPLLRRRRRRATTTGDNPSIHSLSHSHSQSPLGSFIYPSDATGDIEKQLNQTQSPENQDSGGPSPQHQDKRELRNGCPLVYISNPVYDGESGSRRSKVEDDGDGTPFETPGSSPSRLETEECSSGDDDEREEMMMCSKVVVTVTPPLTPMKKLPAEAVSVCMKDVGSLGTSGSDSQSNNGASSSTSLTPCTSPSL